VIPVGLLLLISGIVRASGSNLFGLFEVVALGPLLALIGAWLDARRGQVIGLLVLALGALLAFDGAIASSLLASLIAGIVARRQQSAVSPDE
jgi:hypothetical protein